MNKNTLSLYLREFINILLLPASFHSGLTLVKPTVFAFYLTKKCNSRCRMCDFWKSGKTADELSYDEVCRILDDLKNFGVKTISFSAEGEIFTRTDSVDILRYAKEKGFIFGVNSNGLAINRELAGELAEIQPNSIVFSIDTTDSEKYHSIRGVKGGLGKVTQSIENLQASGYTKISGGAVIGDMNVNELTRLLIFAESHNLHSFRFTAMQRDGFSKEWGAGEWEALADRAFLDRLNRELAKIMSLVEHNRMLSNTIPYLQKIPAYFAAEHFYPVPCVEGHYKGKIMPNGDLSLCPIIGTDAIVGNLKKERVASLWGSERAKKIREQIRRKQCPGCWLSCYGEDNLRFSTKYALASNLKALRRALRLL